MIIDRLKMNEARYKTLGDIMTLRGFLFALLICLSAANIFSMESPEKKAHTASSTLGDDELVTLISQDGQDFKVEVGVAKLAQTLKHLMDDAGIDNPIPLPNITSRILGKILELLHIDKVTNGKTTITLDTVKSFDGSTLIDFIAAVNYLDIPGLLEIAILVARHMDIKNLPPSLFTLPKEIRNDIIGGQASSLLGKPVKKLSHLKKRAYTERVDCVCVTPDNSKIIAGFYDKTIRVWDIATRSQIAILRGYRGDINSVTVTPDASKIISGSSDGTIIIWDMKTYKPFTLLHGHTGSVSSVCVTPDGSKIISGSSDGTVRIWDLRTYQILKVIEAGEWISSVGITPDGKKIIAGSKGRALRNGTIRIWELQSLHQLAILKGHTGIIESICITPDGSKIISGSRTLMHMGFTGKLDNTIRVWNMNDYQVLAVLEGHKGGINSVSVTFDGTKIISGSEDGKARIWDLGTYLLLAELPVLNRPDDYHRNVVHSVCVTHDDNMIIAGTGDGIVIWDISAYKLEPLIKNMSREQAQAVFNYLKGDHAAGWDGLKAIFGLPIAPAQAEMHGAQPVEKKHKKGEE